MSHRVREDLVRYLAAVIDVDSPPGLAATTLARAVVALVEDRPARDASVLAGEVEKLGKEYPR